ncbi:hypothetical protein [Stenotrophomonas sp. PS02289]|uniref:hypothetical protein n=1 Tax=Stenotrophomonas sp. PS02289 TaxID=2991422 RepID=UPI00249BFF15|nr:hypothetical protein [Stenotrophomonas sp. PS02289]
MAAPPTWKWTSLALLLVLMGGCDRIPQSASVSGGTRPGTEWWGLVKENPSPRQGVDFTWQVHDAPGPFAEVLARAQYDVVNEDECGYVHPMTGTAMRMTTSRDVALRRAESGEHSGTVLLDLLLDGDYYGRGVCRWEFTTLSVVARATGSEGETRFTGFMDSATVLGGGSLTHYYPDMEYPRVDAYANYPSLGLTELDRFKPEVRGNTFSSRMSSSGRKHEN